MDTYFKSFEVAVSDDGLVRADLDIEQGKDNTVLLGVWPKDYSGGLYVSMDVEQARAVVEALHFAIIKTEFGAAYESEDDES